MSFNEKTNLKIELNEVLFIKNGFKNAASKFGICLNNLPNKDYSNSINGNNDKNPIVLLIKILVQQA